MHKVLQAHNPKKHAKSFKYAFDGVFHTLANEANFRVQILVATVVVLLGVYLRINIEQWSILVLAIGMLLAAEMVNTVVENVVDALIKEYHEAVKIIKDVSAGYVLIIAIANLIVYLLIFGHPLLLLIS